MSKLESIRQAPTFGDVFDLANNKHFHPSLLEWLIRLPLQRAEELARCLGVSNTTIYDQLVIHERMGAIDYIILAESGARAHRRYYASDIGIYAFAERHNPPYQASALAKATPVCERDLYELILHQETLILLTNLISHLVSDARTQKHYRILHLQHPTALPYRDQGRRHTLVSDALLTMKNENGHTQTFMLYIDGCEQSDQQCSLQRNWLIRLLEARNSFLGRRISFPYPLIITIPDRLHIWGKLLTRVSHERGMRVPIGSITHTSYLKGGTYAPIWWRFSDIAEGSTAGTSDEFINTIEAIECFSLAHLLDRLPPEAPTRRVQTEQQLVTLYRLQAGDASSPSLNRPIARLVGGNLRNDANLLSPAHLYAKHLIDADLTRLFALLTLKLPSQEKAILALLIRHPLLCISDLSVLLMPNAKTSRAINEHVTNLLHLGLLHIYEWDGGSSRNERVRYKLTETALRFAAERYNISSRYYLILHSSKEESVAQGSQKMHWVQRGVPGLEAQDDHTIGFYRCLVASVRIAREKRDHSILFWKSAFESVREYSVPLSYTRSQLRPDGEVCYTTDILAQPKTFLIEYDRATSENREYKKKFSAYRDYIEATHLIPPPILVITQTSRAAEKMRAIAHKTEPRLTVITILEENLLRDGLYTSIELAYIEDTPFEQPGKKARYASGK